MSEMSNNRKNTKWGLAILSIMVWLVYANSLTNPYHFDDFHVIVENPAVHGISEIPSFYTDVKKFSVMTVNQGYRPVFLTSMALCWWLGDGSTLPFHLVSITLHLANALLLFFIFRWFFSLNRGLGKTLSVKARDWAALSGAAIFALHPLATEPVNYISSQSALLTAFFYLLSFYLFLTVYGDENGPSSQGTRLRRVGSYLTYFLGLLSKPIAITLPVNLLLWELLLGRDAKEQPTPSLPARLWKRLLKHLPYAGITLIYLLIRQSVMPAPFGSAARSITSHYLTQTKALVLYYLKHIFVPTGLNVDAEFAISHSPFEASVLFSFIVIVLIAFLLFKFRKQRVLIFWALWFPVCLLVTTYLTILYQVVNEHRVYLSLAGISALAGWFLARLRAAFPLDVSDLSVGPRSGKTLVALLLLCVLVFLGLETRGRNRVWASDFALWEDAALNGGTWRAHMNYGLALENENRPDEAFLQFKKAVELFPGAYSHINLGLAYIRREDLQQGLAHLEKAVELWPDLPEAHLFLAYGLEKNGQFEAAENEYNAAIHFRPNYLKGYSMLAEFYEKRGEPGKAYATYKKLLETDPTQSWVEARLAGLTGFATDEAAHQFDWGFKEISEGNYSEAVAILTDAYSQYPKESDLLFNLAFSHQMLNNRDEAIRYYEELLHVDPTHVKGHFNLAYAYMDGTSKEEWSRSCFLFERVLQFDPDYSEALFRLATIYWKIGDEAEAKRYDQLYLEQGIHENLKRTSRLRLSPKK